MTIKEKDLMERNLLYVEEYLDHEEEFMALSDEDASAEGYKAWEKERKKNAKKD